MTREDFILASIATVAAFDADRERAFERTPAPISLDRAISLARSFGATYDMSQVAIAATSGTQDDDVPMTEVAEEVIVNKASRKGRKRGA